MRRIQPIDLHTDAEITVHDANDNELAQFTIGIAYRVIFGTAPAGISGPPEHYDPGSGDEVEIVSVQAEYDWQTQFAESWIEKNRDWCIAQAHENAGADADDAADHKREMMRDRA